jgi:hypothetical protein
LIRTWAEFGTLGSTVIVSLPSPPVTVISARPGSPGQARAVAPLGAQPSEV